MTTVMVGRLKVKRIKCAVCHCKKIEPFQEDVEDVKRKCGRGTSCGLEGKDISMLPFRFPADQYDVVDAPAPMELHITTPSFVQVSE